MSTIEILRSFTIDDLPTLDTAVLGALQLLEQSQAVDTTVPFHRPLIVGSGNAIATGRIIFKNTDAVLADESDFEAALDRVPSIDGAVLISASGGKHAVSIAAMLAKRQLPAVLFTNNPAPAAANSFKAENIRIFPKNREPYTYNTSTYLSMILADESGSAAAIRQFIETEFSRLLPANFADFSAFTFVVPAEFGELRPMLRTKFDELFGPMVTGRFFVPEELKHAKTVIPSADELFISVGLPPADLGREAQWLEAPLPPSGGYAGALAATYFLVGLIQRSKPPYFQDNIVNYCEKASQMFGQEIKPIVE